MNNAYLAICYVCNQYCSYCPCGNRKKLKNAITPFEDLKEKIDSMKRKGIEHITLSGGEPTLHPYFIELVKYICELGINVTILSNGENFADDIFFQKIRNNFDYSKIRVITTIHSQDCFEHEKANQKVGSFNKTILGLKKIEALGIKVIIKHCITKENYKDLALFYKFIDQKFEKDTDIQLCAIDYVGIPTVRLQEEKLTFPEIKPYLERLFDANIASTKPRKLYCVNIPLCSCDPYYWKYIPIRKLRMYDSYSDPGKDSVVEVEDNVSVDENYCGSCAVKSICNGTYHTAFSNFGSSMVKPYERVE